MCACVCECVCLSGGWQTVRAGKRGKTNEGIVGSSPGQHTSLIDG